MATRKPATKAKAISDPVPIDQPQSDPIAPDALTPDEEHKYGKPGGSVRTFTLLTNPVLDHDGIYMLPLWEVTLDETTPDGRAYALIEPNMTIEEVNSFVDQNGQWAE